MKLKKKNVLILLTLMFILMTSMFSMVSARTENKWFGLELLRESGNGYIVNGKNVWEICSYGTGTTPSAVADHSETIYCLRAGIGFGSNNWGNSETEKKLYTSSFDMKQEKIPAEYLSVLPEGETYKKMLWILDNSYIEGQTNKIEFLNSIGIKYDSTEGKYFYEPISGYDYSSHISGNSAMFGYSTDHLMTESDIKAVQRAVIWYYTNYMQDKTNDEVFNNKDSESDWLTITTDGSSYQQLADYNKTTGEGIERFEQAQILYNYLIDAASKNASNYKADNNYTIANGITVNTTGLTQNSNKKYRLTTTRTGSNYVVGPIVIDKNGSLSNEVSIKVTDQNNRDISYTFTDSKGNSLGTTDIKNLVGKTEGFYITVPRNGIEKVNIDDIIKLCKNNIGNKYLMPIKEIKVYVKKGKIFFMA